MRLLSVDASTLGRDRVALAALIESAEVDVACVHGGPHLLRWRSISAAIGRRSGLVMVAGGRPAGANLVLSTLGVDDLGHRDLDLGAGSRLHPTGVALARLRRHTTEFVVGTAALVGNAAARVAQAGAVQDAIAQLAPAGTPAIVSVLGADRPGTAAWLSLANGRTAVAERIFIDERFSVGAVRELDTSNRSALPPVVVEIGPPAR